MYIHTHTHLKHETILTQKPTFNTKKSLNVCRFNHTVTLMSGQGNVSKGMSSMQTKNL